jgi:2-C-methyl-D-erythritol 4-phosphate cytidylyltransferase
LERVIAGCEGYDGCIPIMRPHDTVKSIAGSVIQATIDRETLGLAQTPQAFRNGVLKRAFTQAEKDHVVGTDEAALVERIGGRIAWVEGEEGNLKITTPRDLEIAELFGREII